MLWLLALACALLLAVAQENDIWELYKVRYSKTYLNKMEESVRRGIFQSALPKIQRHNLMADMGFSTYRQGLTQFTDMTNQEFRLTRNGLRVNTSSLGTDPKHVYDREELPTHVDWRTKGYVTPIKDQGACGSCWAFSATGSLEGQHYAKSGKLVSLSEQNLIDCSWSQGNFGCLGGLMDWAFTYVIANRGLDTEECYPYMAQGGQCKFNTSCIGTTEVSYKNITTGSEKDLEQALVTVGPISVAIDASQQSFQYYKSGIYDEPACSSVVLDHGVLAVGYGADSSGVEYYIVKNSWGTDWGMKGYVWMSRNKANQCGIATSASYPIV